MTTKTDQSKEVLKDIKNIASGVYKTILARQPPKVDMPLRALSNVKYDPKEGFFELLDQKKERTLTASTIKTFAQTLRMMSLSKRAHQDRRHRHEERSVLRLEELGRSPIQRTAGIRRSHGRHRSHAHGEPRADGIHPRRERRRCGWPARGC